MHDDVRWLHDHVNRGRWIHGRDVWLHDHVNHGLTRVVGPFAVVTEELFGLSVKRLVLCLVTAYSLLCGNITEHILS